MADRIPQFPLNSTFLTEGGHDPQQQAAEVTLNGGRVYRIEGISAEAWNELKDADSVGRHFNTVIKPNYTITQVEG